MTSADPPSGFSTFRDDVVPFYIANRRRRPPAHSPIVVDNGSYECRVGFSIDEDPILRCSSAVAKARSRLSGESDRVGDHILPEEWFRGRYRSSFEGNVVCNFGSMESVLDYAFATLNIHDERVDHPIVMTECPCNPNYSRGHMNELLFECYGTSSVCFGIDDLFAYSYNASLGSVDPDNGLVVGVGHETTHIIPIVDSRPLLAQSCRISIGGFHMVDNLLQRLVLEYPQHKQALSFHRVQELVHRFCYSSLDFPAELESYAPESDSAITVQLPYEVERRKVLSEEEKRLKSEKQRENGLRLQQLAEERREKKFLAQTTLLSSYEELLEEKSSGSVSDAKFQAQIRKGGFDDEQDFMKTYKALKKKLEVQIRRRSGEQADPADTKSDSVLYPLLLVPDDDLNEEERKEKRRQKMMKGGAEARDRKRIEKIELANKLAEEKALERQRFEADPNVFLADLESRKRALLERKAQRLKTKEELSDRRSGAVKRRMRIIAEMGSAVPDTAGFGRSDADWDVYRRVANDDGSNSEEEQNELKVLEEKLREYAPDRIVESAEPHEGHALHYQMHLSTHRIRQGEILFQPSMVGVDEAGLAEAISTVLSRVDSHSPRLVKNVLLSGGGSALRRLDLRVQAELVQRRPIHSLVKVRASANPALDAWYGARLFAQSPEFSQAQVTRAQYEECGSSYLTEHRYGNVHVPRPHHHHHHHHSSSRKRQR